MDKNKYFKLEIYKERGCNRCGACCVYFDIKKDKTRGLPLVAIRTPTETFKKAGDICEHLLYDIKTQKTSCDIYDEERTKDCRVFNCNGETDLTGRRFVKKDLEIIAEKIRGLEKSGRIKDLLKF